MSQVIQVRNVPDDVHAELARQAEDTGVSLNRFLLSEFERIARRGRNRELFQRAAKRPGRRAPSGEIVKAIRRDRERSH